MVIDENDLFNRQRRIGSAQRTKVVEIAQALSWQRKEYET
jgi:hypothetical protein